MDAKLGILKRLDEVCKARRLNDFGSVQWSDGQLLRACAIRAERGDDTAWGAFIQYLQQNRATAKGIDQLLRHLGWLFYSHEQERLQLALPYQFDPLSTSAVQQLLDVLGRDRETNDAEPAPSNRGLGKIMYIEEKPGLTGRARIGRVTFSKSRQTIYYQGRKLQRTSGYKYNYFNVDSRLNYWISNCKQEGNDTLYPGVVGIDEDAREEYWRVIRRLPDNAHLTRFRSEGKYAKRRPC
jgi:hypothetical protein